MGRVRTSLAVPAYLGMLHDGFHGFVRHGFCLWHRANVPRDGVGYTLGRIDVGMQTGHASSVYGSGQDIRLNGC